MIKPLDYWRMLAALTLATAALTMSPRASAQVEIESLGTGTESLIGGDLTDPEDDGDEFAGEEDSSWNWVSIWSDDEPGFEGGEFAYNVFDNTLGPGNAKWCCTDATPDNPRWITVEFAKPVRLSHFTLSSANDVPGRDPTVWAIQGSNEGSSAEDSDDFEDIYRHEDVDAVWTERLEVVKFTLPRPSKPYKFIRYIAYDNNDSLHQIGEIEYFGAVESTLTNGLIGYWSFNDLKPGSSQALDASANTNIGTVNGNPALTEGPAGVPEDVAIDFDGIDDSVTTEGNIMNDIGDYTMSGWVKFGQQSGNRVGLFGQNDAVEFGMINPSTMQHWTAAGGAFDVPFGPEIEEWTNIIIVATPDERILYVNGEEEMRGGGVQQTNSGFNFNIGGDGVYDATGNFFVGQMDDVAVWNRPLTPEEALEVYENRSVIPLDLVDTDGDGMGDSYEIDNGLDPFNAADKELDKDGDGLSNFAEFQKRTNPSEKDTDDDGLEDNVETDTGVWVSAADTGTNPLKPDTDKDKLLDGVETNTGVFVSASNTGTNPLNPDTDGDGAADGTEVTGGTNPLDPLAVPSPLLGNGEWDITHIYTAGNPQLNDAFGVEDALADPQDAEVVTVKSKWIHFHDNVAPPWFTDESVPYPLWNEDIGGEGGFGDRNDFAIEATGNIFVKEAGVITFVCNSDDGFQLFIDDELIGEAGNRGRADTIMEADLTSGVHAVRFIHWERGGGAGVSLANYRGTGVAPAPNASDWELTRPYVDTTDSDGDGITDLYEEANDLDPDSNDADLDKDGDGLTNKREFEIGTRANLADTDGDGVQDGAETKTGTFVGPNNTGTDPLKPDSDRDGLSDGVETGTGVFVSATNTGTNPNKQDSDGDLVNDGVELGYGSDPNDANDGPVNPDGPNLLAWWDFEDSADDSVAVDVVSGLEAANNGAEYGDGHDGGGMVFSAGGGGLHIEDAGFMNLAATIDKATFVLWQKNLGTPNSSSFWFNSVIGEGRGAQAHIPWSNNNVYFDTVGCCDAGAERVNGDPSGQVDDFDWADEQWHHWVFVKDGEDKRVYLDGTMVLDSTGAKAFPSDFTDGYIGADGGGGNNPDAIIDDFAVFAWALTEDQIMQLVDGASPGDLAGIGGGVPFQIQTVTKSAAGVSITWPSRQGGEYSVEFSGNLEPDEWIELDDGIEADGEETTFVDSDNERLALPGGYYRVRKN